MLVLEDLVGLHRTVQLHLLQHYCLVTRLGLLWYWMAGLWNKQRSFCCFQTAPKYCILDTFVDYEAMKRWKMYSARFQHMVYLEECFMCPKRRMHIQPRMGAVFFNICQLDWVLLKFYNTLLICLLLVQPIICHLFGENWNGDVTNLYLYAKELEYTKQGLSWRISIM